MSTQSHIAYPYKHTSRAKHLRAMFCKATVSTDFDRERSLFSARPVSALQILYSACRYLRFARKTSSKVALAEGGEQTPIEDHVQRPPA